MNNTANQTTESHPNDHKPEFSRRGFMMTAAGLGAAATVVGTPGKANADCFTDIDSWTFNNKCKNTLKLICDMTFGDIFTKPAYKLFEKDGTPKIDRLVSPSDWAFMQGFYQRLKNNYGSLSLAELYGRDIDGSNGSPNPWPGDLPTNARNAAQRMALPFCHIPNGPARLRAGVFLDESNPFLTKFKDVTLYDAYTKPIEDTVTASQLEEILLLKEAKALGILRFFPIVRAADFMSTQALLKATGRDLGAMGADLDKGKCGYWSSFAGIWDCQTSSNNDDVCGVDGGQLQQGSDICS